VLLLLLRWRLHLSPGAHLASAPVALIRRVTRYDCMTVSGSLQWTLWYYMEAQSVLRLRVTWERRILFEGPACALRERCCGCGRCGAVSCALSWRLSQLPRFHAGLIGRAHLMSVPFRMDERHINRPLISFHFNFPRPVPNVIVILD